ncbi:MAG TPA: response regulator transcription factor, partial [Anaerolineales bacterium]|nr:response regulator transcription factor [Anaerolineales bacterium]
KVIVAAAMLAARVGLRALLEADEQVEVTAESASVSDLGQQPMPVDVYVVMAAAGDSLVDADFPSGTEDLAGVLLLTDEPEIALPLAGLPLRGWGLLPTDCTESELLTALFAVELGLVAAAPEQIETLLRPNRKLSNSGDEPDVTLTPRELEVLTLLTEGLSNKQVSYQLGISEHTVKFHVTSIYSKLGVSNRAEAVRLGIQYGLIML